VSPIVIVTQIFIMLESRVVENGVMVKKEGAVGYG
jgi:hypothetical protein